MEITVSRDAGEQVLAVRGKWRDRGGGWLESELHGAAQGAELAVTGAVAVQVPRLLRAPLPVRRIELDLQYGSGQLTVRHSPSLGSQLFGLRFPGTLTALRDDGAYEEDVDVRITWDQLRNLAMNLVLAPPEREDQV